MAYFLFRRFIYAIAVLIGVNFLTFMLFFAVNTPDDMARLAIGGKRVSAEAIEQWKTQKGYDQPLFINAERSGVERLTQTIFYERSLQMFTLDFGMSDGGKNITQDIKERMWPSLALAVPTFIFGLLVSITFSLLLVFFRQTYLDLTGVVVCVVLMSISALFYIIAGQFVFAKVLRLVPLSGYADGLQAWRFLVLPTIIGVIAGLGGQARFMRSLFLEEISKDYVRTARAKGVPERLILAKHVLKNASLPILTGAMAAVPALFMGSFLMESFFAIPGLGSYTIDAIAAQDFSIVRVMVFIGAAMYILGLLLADLSYTLVDPRIRFE